MTKETAIMEVLEARAKRREERRDFLLTSRGAALAAAGVTFLSGCGLFDDDDNDNGNGTPPPPPPPPPPPGITDADILNFALNLEYLEAQFYAFAATGAGLPANLLGGAGTQGQVMGGRMVNFTDPIVAQYAREIAGDERAHVAFLRTALGNAAVAQPAIDIRGNDPNASFSAAARAAGLIGAGETFDPYASDENFLLGAFIFEDVGVTAYKGASPLLESATFLEAAAGILAAEAYHSGLIRTTLFGKGIQTPSAMLIEATEAISDARDSLDGPEDKDQGIAPNGDASNIVPSDSDGIAFSRTAGEVLNIVYLNSAAVDEGGFFPQGVNGTIMTSDAN